MIPKKNIRLEIFRLRTEEKLSFIEIGRKFRMAEDDVKFVFNLHKAAVDRRRILGELADLDITLIPLLKRAIGVNTLTLIDLKNWLENTKGWKNIIFDLHEDVNSVMLAMGRIEKFARENGIRPRE